MQITAVFAQLALLSLVPPLYIAANVAFLRLYTRYARPVVRRAWVLQRKFTRPILRAQLASITVRRIVLTACVQGLSTVALLFVLLDAQSLLYLASALLGYALIITSTTFSFLLRLPLVQAVWNDVATKICLAAVPLYLSYLSHGYAAQWAAEVAGASGASLGYAVLAGTTFLYCALTALVLGVLGLGFEIALIFGPFTGGKTREEEFKKVGLSAMILTVMLSLYFASTALFQFPTSRLGKVLMAAVAFELDAMPADRCDLDARERALSDKNVMRMKVLQITTGLDRGLLVERSPALLWPVILRGLRQGDSNARQILPVRVVKCNVPESQGTNHAPEYVFPRPYH